MNVHITCTPEYSIEELTEIVELLNTISGEIIFSCNKDHQFTSENFSYVVEKFKHPESINSISFSEFFKLCDFFRSTRNLSKDDFVVMITSIPNDLNWFSAFDNKNIFVNSEDWKYYSDKDSKFGIAYQIVENVFQSLINLNISDVNNEPNIHFDSIGCINDMCINKSEVLFKLRTADICESCSKRAEIEGLDQLIMNQILEIIDLVRKEFRRTNPIKVEVPNEIVKVDEKLNIEIGNKLISIMPTFKVVYVLLLKYNEGLVIQKIYNFYDECCEFYKGCEGKLVDLTPIKKIIAPKDYDFNYLSQIKNKINTKLVEILGANNADNYLIELDKAEKPNNKYKINIEKNKIKIDSKYL
jgi:hypothetical protein